MYIIILRSIIIFAFVLIVMRIMGKRQLGQMQPFEFAITLLAADIATVPMADPSIPLWHGVVPLITLAAIHFLVSFVSYRSINFRKFINGKPLILVSPDGINEDNLKKLNMNLNDLNEVLKNLEYHNIEEIHYAIIETNGTVNVILKNEFQPATKKDVNNKDSEPVLDYMVISDGKISKENLIELNISEADLLCLLLKQNIKKVKEVYACYINNYGKVYIQPKNKKFILLHVDLKEMKQ